MNVVDLRPGYERLLVWLWQGRGVNSNPDWWSRLLGKFTVARVARRGRLPQRPFVISVGNICLGGSGKTPVVGQLAADLAQQGLVVGILTRGYGSAEPGPLVVEKNCAGCGDEARMLAGRLDSLGVMVVQAAHRSEGLAFLTDQQPDLDCVVLEDGFQTQSIGRHLDILLLNTWQVDGQKRLVPLGGPVLPWGPWREPVSAASRADLILVESSSPVPGVGTAGQPVFSFVRHNRLVAITGGEVTFVERETWAAISGIAHPLGFEQTAAGLMKCDPALVIRGRDHEPYGAKTMALMERALLSSGVSAVVTTAKDWVKLSGKLSDRWRVYLVSQDVEWGMSKTLPDYVRERLADQAEAGV